MYLWLRNSHLAAGLFSVLFLLVYGVSAVQMAHHDWFKLKPTVTEERVSVRPELAENPRALARALMDERGLRGELGKIETTEQGFKFIISRPGTNYAIDYSRASGEAHVRTSVATFMGTLNRLHHAAGFWHPYPALQVWSGCVALVSLALLILGGTGIYLWFNLREERRVGIVLLALSLAYSLPLIFWMRMG